MNEYEIWKRYVLVKENNFFATHTLYFQNNFNNIEKSLTTPWTNLLTWKLWP